MYSLSLQEYKMAHKKTETLEERFEKLINMEDSLGCWNWKGTMAKGVLPMFTTRMPDGKTFSMSARRYAFIYTDIPLEKDNSEIWNRCGNVFCIKPSHQIENTLWNRFWLLVDVGSPNECWNWEGSSTKGYGNFEGSKAHRISYKLQHGEFDPKLDVLHKCDNPSCVNPKHLFLGSHIQNMQDMVNKGRSVRGEDCSFHKLTEQTVKEIRIKSANGQSSYSLAREYEVDPKTIRSAVNKKTWYWLE
jgi:hypothetical protein